MEQKMCLVVPRFWKHPQSQKNLRNSETQTTVMYVLFFSTKVFKTNSSTNKNRYECATNSLNILDDECNAVNVLMPGVLMFLGVLRGSGPLRRFIEKQRVLVFR